MEIFERLSKAVSDRDPALTESIAKEAVQKQIDPLEAIQRGLVQGIITVGYKYRTGEFYLADLIMGAEAFKAGMNVLQPELSRLRKESKVVGIVLLGTVAGDIHSLGKDIVATLLTAGGFQVYDIGVDVPIEKFIENVKTLKPDILGMSALMTTSIGQQRDVLKALQTEGLRGKVKVLIGGAATSDPWRIEIGADGWAATAVESVGKAKELARAE
jgi:5-methyltetrahydrofolate--homocysteine methyltransferase